MRIKSDDLLERLRTIPLPTVPADGNCQSFDGGVVFDRSTPLSEDLRDSRVQNPAETTPEQRAAISNLPPGVQPAIQRAAVELDPLPPSVPETSLVTTPPAANPVIRKTLRLSPAASVTAPVYEEPPQPERPQKRQRRKSKAEKVFPPLQPIAPPFIPTPVPGAAIIQNVPPTEARLAPVKAVSSPPGYPSQKSPNSTTVNFDEIVWEFHRRGMTVLEGGEKLRVDGKKSDLLWFAQIVSELNQEDKNLLRLELTGTELPPPDSKQFEPTVYDLNPNIDDLIFDDEPPVNQMPAEEREASLDQFIVDRYADQGVQTKPATFTVDDLLSEQRYLENERAASERRVGRLFTTAHSDGRSKNENVDDRNYLANVNDLGFSDSPYFNMADQYGKWRDGKPKKSEPTSDEYKPIKTRPDGTKQCPDCHEGTLEMLEPDISKWKFDHARHEGIEVLYCKTGKSFFTLNWSSDSSEREIPIKVENEFYYGHFDPTGGEWVDTVVVRKGRPN